MDLLLPKKTKEAFHWILPGALDEKEATPLVQTEDYTSLTKRFHTKKKATEDKTVIAVNAGTPGYLDLTKITEKDSVNNTQMLVLQKNTR